MALRYHLDHALSENQLLCIVVVDAGGKVVEFAGDPALSKELTVIAPVLHESALAVRLNSIMQGKHVNVVSTRLWGQQCLVAACAGAPIAHLKLQQVASGLERISASN